MLTKVVADAFGDDVGELPGLWIFSSVMLAVVEHQSRKLMRGVCPIR